MTPAQKAARDRNYIIFRLKGMIKQLNNIQDKESNVKKRLLLHLSAKKLIRTLEEYKGETL